MHFKIFLIFMALLFSQSSNICNAQSQGEEVPAARQKHSIGAGAGFTTGYGLSYRYRPTRFGGQVNFAPYIDKDTKRFSFGLTFIYTLYESKISNFYLYEGNHYYYNSQVNDVYTSYSPNISYEQRVSEGFINNGVGFGFEFVIAKKIGLNLMAGYAAYKNFQQLNITGETALYYKF